jgi:hypothetical protein
MEKRVAERLTSTSKEAPVLRGTVHCFALLPRIGRLTRKGRPSPAEEPRECH